MASGESNDERTQSFVALTKDTRISHYKVIKKIGMGGMGEVYLAQDTELDRRVALKFLPPDLCRDEHCRARFKREAKAAARLDHSNIVTVHEVGEFHDRPYFVMQHIEGRSLRDIIRQNTLTVEEIVDLGIQICDGLREAHEAGIIHRDLKPSNILIDIRGRPKLTDFGLAFIKGSEKLTKSGSTMGTAGYMSPEQAEGKKVDHRSDLFSLGVVMYEMITGRQPFSGEHQQAVIHSILRHTPEPLARYKSEVPEELQHAVDKAMRKDPATRYQSADELLADLKMLKHQLDSGKSGVLVGGLSRRPIRLRSMVTGAVVVVALAVTLIVEPSIRQAALRFMGLRKVPATRHLVVLPFVNPGDSPESQALSDGLMETLTSKLTEIEKFQSSLRVVPACEVRQRQVASASQARRAFGATLAVSGSVQSLNGDIRMTLNLVDTKTQTQLSSKVIDDSASNVSSLQDSTVIRLAEMLEIQLEPEQRQRLLAGGTAKREAYLCYVRARGYLARYEKLENIDTSIAAFQRALEIDPNYALAYAGLGESYWRKYETLADPDLEQLAIFNSRRAIELNDKAAPVYMTLGVIHQGRGRYEEAVEEFKRALSLDSTNRDTYRQLASAYAALNKSAQAESTFQKTMELWPDDWTGYFDLGSFYYRRGQYDDALKQADYATGLDPEGYVAWNNLGGLYCNLGRYDKARAMWERALEIEPTYGTCSNLGIVYFLEGRYQDAARMYKQALGLNDRDYRVWINFASTLSQVPGAREEMLDAYRQAVVRAQQQLVINPRNADVLSNLADCYAILSERDLAISNIRQALALAPDDVEILSMAGIIYERLGERDSALTWFARAVDCGYQLDDVEALPEMRSLMSDPRYQNLIAADRAEPGNDTSLRQ